MVAAGPLARPGTGRAPMRMHRAMRDAPRQTVHRGPQEARALVQGDYPPVSCPPLRLPAPVRKPRPPESYVPAVPPENRRRAPRRNPPRERHPKNPRLGLEKNLWKGGSRGKAFEEQSDEKAGGDGLEMRGEAASAAKTRPPCRKITTISSSRSCAKPARANLRDRVITALKSYKNLYVKLRRPDRVNTRFSPVQNLWKNLWMTVEKITLDIL